MLFTWCRISQRCYHRLGELEASTENTRFPHPVIKRKTPNKATKNTLTLFWALRQSPYQTDSSRIRILLIIATMVTFLCKPGCGFHFTHFTGSGLCDRFSLNNKTQQTSTVHYQRRQCAFSWF